MKTRRLVRTRRKWRQERTAYERWAFHLGSRVPRLVAVEEEPPALVVTELVGRSPEAAELTRAEERSVHRQAGVLLARLHAVADEAHDPRSVEDALVCRAQALCNRAFAEDAPLAELARERVRLVLVDRSRRALPKLRRVPCHRDFEPRNWLVDRRPELTVSIVDFEHARMDVAMADFTRLRTLVWALRPELETHFFDGYGARLDADDRRLLDALAWLDAVGTLVWGRRHRDSEFIGRGRRMIAGLRLTASES